MPEQEKTFRVSVALTVDVDVPTEDEAHDTVALIEDVVRRTGFDVLKFDVVGVDDTKVFSLDRLCDVMRAAGFPAYVEHTGGGVATIYAGEPVDEEGWGPRYVVLVGPGYFEKGGSAYVEASDGVLGPDTDGRGVAVSLQGFTEAQVGALLLESLRGEMVCPECGYTVPRTGHDSTPCPGEGAIPKSAYGKAVLYAH
jgi:hypothetical protein